MFGSQDHGSGSKEGVWSGGEDFDIQIGGCLKSNFGTFRSPDPVSLHGFNRVSPIEGFQVL